VGFPEGEVKVTAVRLAVLRSQPSLVVIRGPLATLRQGSPGPDRLMKPDTAR